MPSDKPRLNFAPDPEVKSDLESVPLMKRSNVINQALKQFFEKQKDLEYKAELLETLEELIDKRDSQFKILTKNFQEIKTLLEQLLKSRK